MHRNKISFGRNLEEAKRNTPAPDIGPSPETSTLAGHPRELTDMKAKPLVNRKYTLERFSGKGGWTFVCLPGVAPDVKRRFGMVKVRGTIDGYAIDQYNLMPMRDGRLFLPVRAEIRKQIGKEAGDTVHILLYPDETPVKAPREMIQCLRDEPAAWKFYQSLTEAEQKAYIDWIYTAKKEETKVERLARAINRLQAGLKRFDQPPT